MKVSVKSNAAQVAKQMRASIPKTRLAGARAITETLKSVKEQMPAALRQDLDKPAPFTEKGFAVRSADAGGSGKMTGYLVILPSQGAYLRYQIEGGSRSPTKKALRLPGQIAKDSYGNIPAGTIKRLVARAKSGKRATKAQGRKFKVSSKVDLFYGEPADGRPAGIYKRVREGTAKNTLVPLILFPKRPAAYRKRFDFYGRAEQIVRKEFEANLKRELARVVVGLK
jgi:hypothetical protein